ncbi:unnamed protein product [Cylindrotheca closterium]|uniref:Uncharacterized protein n=1 Tax=Cylindrotheca closterium TaxID=2856 RepID=A0AAD2FDT5_9STRA|nr:unnamed protein product [Cylindrotheca closterium]
MMDRITSTKVFMLVLFCAHILATHTAQGHRSIRLPFTHFRGGGDEEEEESRIITNQEEDKEEEEWVHIAKTPPTTTTLTVAILRGKDATKTEDTTSSSNENDKKMSWLDDISSPSCLLVAANTEPSSASSGIPIGSIITIPKTLTDESSNHDDYVTLAVVETLALLCDVVVVVLPKQIDGSDPIWAGIVQGANRRKTTSLQKGRLLLISSGKMEFSQDEQQKSMFASVDTIRTDDASAALEDYLSKMVDVTDGMNTLSSLFSSDDEGDGGEESSASSAFLGVLNEVYMSLGGARSKEQKFQFQAIPSAAISTTVATTKTKEESSLTEASVTDATSSQQDSSLVSILATAQSKLTSLEQKVEEAMLTVAEKDDDSADSNNQNSNSGIMPLLFIDFGNLANELLEEAYSALNDHLSSQENDNAAAAIGENVIIANIVGELVRLFREQVRLMRDYYGKRYENVLEQLALEQEQQVQKEKEDKTRVAAIKQLIGQKASVVAEEIIKSFSDACQHAIPKLCKKNENGKLAAEYGADFDYIAYLNGLVNDMLEATTIIEDDDEVDIDSMEDIALYLSRWGKFKASIPKWAKKLAARGIMLGVNYAQGWLAWQGLKRAAAERDRKMPKFPLF